MRLTGKQTKRIVSLLLCLALLVSVLAFALTVRAEEVEEETQTDTDILTIDSSTSDNETDLSHSADLADTGAAVGTVYCKNSAGWGAVYAYMWNSDSDKNAAWPGVKMTGSGNGIWSYDYSKSYSKIIFNIGSNQTQTTDLDFPGSGYLYDNASGSWTQHVVPTTTSSTTSVTPTSAVQPTASGGTSGKTFVYCENEAGWSTVTAYMWNSATDGNSNAGWPGKAMTNIGGNFWRYEVTNSQWDMIIFSQNGANQTSNLNFTGNNAMWNNKTNSWGIYDPSILRVDSYGTDLESPQYNGVGITLTASAEGQGTVYYKFSVTNSSGSTTVLKDFNTANSVQWIPQTVGSYTLTYDFKDAVGNTNKRTKTYVIEDGLSSVAPYFKTVTPNGGEIQNNKNCNLSVSAGGGFTGTNLLFYKYTVKNSSGTIINTPYYTRNTSYTFKPTSLGEYSVTVNIQGSDNKTIERTYNFTSVGTVTPTTAPATQPATTAPTPTQAPTTYVPPTEQSGSPVIYGDADDDGEVYILDVTYIQRYEAGIYLPTPLNERNADVDDDDMVSILDATLIQRYVAGIIDRFPAEA